MNILLIIINIIIFCIGHMLAWVMEFILLVNSDHNLRVCPVDVVCTWLTTMTYPHEPDPIRSIQ
jgi:hypothetical protein